jgi:predicted metal-dependent HD superfamily phosphohydrolase
MSQIKALIPEAEDFSRKYLSQCEAMGLAFHTTPHTEQVVEAARDLCNKLEVNETDTSEIILAAWFHDLGYTKAYIGHEDESKRIAEEFLRSKGCDNALIKRIQDLIEATRLSVEPEGLHQEIIKDADLFNLATDEALDYTAQLRKEWMLFYQKEYDDETWLAINIDFYKNHRYYTTVGIETLSEKKAANIKVLEEQLARIEGAKEKKETKKEKARKLRKELVKAEKDIQKLEGKIAKLKVLKPDRGIETMFRTTYGTHIALSAIADNKANILLSINAIIISILFSTILRQLDLYPVMVWPAISLLLVCMVTIVFSILATRPNVNSGTFTREDILNKKTNLLFFGNFFNMPLDDYLWGICEMMNDSEFLYGSMSKDIYFLGVVLAKRFKMLRLAYTIFMYGMIISVMLFALAIIAQNQGW